jgi:hypothetical protein
VDLGVAQKIDRQVREDISIAIKKYVKRGNGKREERVWINKLG